MAPSGCFLALHILMWLLGCARPGPVSPTAIMHAVEDDLPAELVVSGPLAERVRTDPADLIVYYGGEERGSLEPCGCPTRPRGGLSRQASYIAASQAASPDAGHLVVNGGYWLEDAVGIDGRPRPDTAVMNRWMLAGVSALGVDALNVGYPDMAGLRSQDRIPPGLPLVSANISGEGIRPHRIVVTGGLRVGVTGISTPGSRAIETPDFEVSDPARAGAEALGVLRQRTDVTVLLSYQAAEAARRLARAGLADVVIDIQGHRERYAPIRVGDAIWVRSHYQTMRIGELRLSIDSGRITQVMDRKIDLDAEIPAQPEMRSIVRSARAALDAVQQEIYGR